VMRDLTVDTTHTYYVLAGNEPVLVHNNDACSLLDRRASEIHDVLDDGTASGKRALKNGTTAVVRAQRPDGSIVDVVAANGDGLTDAQKAVLRGGEIDAVNNPNLHAELNAMEHINNMGWTKLEGGSSRNVCPYCENSIRDQGGAVVGPANWRQRVFGPTRTFYPFGQRNFVFRGKK
jgi:hypothetical protein